MTYQLLQDAHQSSPLGARATALLAAQARVARAARELRDAVAAEEKASTAYEHVRGVSRPVLSDEEKSWLTSLTNQQNRSE